MQVLCELLVSENRTGLKSYGSQGSKQQKPNLSLVGAHDGMRKELSKGEKMGGGTKD